MSGKGKRAVPWETRFKGFAGEVDRRRRSDQIVELIEEAGPEEIETILKYLRAASERERLAALKLCYRLSTREQAEFLRRSSQLLGALVGIVERGFPKTDEGIVAWNTLAGLAPDRAVTFVEAERLKAMDDETRKEIARSAWYLGRSAGVRVLETIRGLGATAGEVAESEIKLRWGPSEEQLRHASETWRRTRSSKALGGLYYDFVTREGVGTPLARLVEVLGEPSGRTERLRSVWWASKRGKALEVTLDPEERVQSHSLSD